MNYYLVSQGQTHKYEFDHKMLWSPQRKKPGKNQLKGTLYKNMNNVRKGDIIFHGYDKAIRAVSIAKTNSYPYLKPEKIGNTKGTNWNKKGFRVDLDMNNNVYVPLHKYKKYLQRKDYKGFDKNGALKQVYLSKLSSESISLLLNVLPLKVSNWIIKKSRNTKEKAKTSLGKIHYHHVTDDSPVIKSKHHKSKNGQKSKGMSNRQHLQRSKSKLSNGVLGEYYTCLDIQKRFNSSNYILEGKSRNFTDSLAKTFPQIIPSLNENYGCDYVVTDKHDRNHKIFIDSKATSGGPSTPFYMSTNEKAKWDMAKHSNGKLIYELYRGYYIRSNKYRNGEYFASNDHNNGINDQNDNLSKQNRPVFVRKIVYEVKPYRKSSKK